jgi:hypothetical protein
MRVVLIPLAALVSVVPVTVGAAPLRLSSGLHGVVMRGPTKPVCPEEQSCEKQAARIVLRFSRDGRLVAWAKTDTSGAYRVRLRPGTYTVKTTTRTVGSGLTPRVVPVPRERLARVDFHLDTGIQ